MSEILLGLNILVSVFTLLGVAGGAFWWGGKATAIMDELKHENAETKQNLKEESALLHGRITKVEGKSEENAREITGIKSNCAAVHRTG